MRKILIFNKTLKVGGAERQLFYVAKALMMEKDVQVDFLLCSKTGELIKQVESLGCRIDTISVSGRWSTARKLRQVIQREKYETVLTYLPECNLLSELAAIPSRKWKVVVGARSANPAFLNNWKLRFYYWAHLLADYVISNSHKNANDILSVNHLLSPQRLIVSYNIIEIQDFAGFLNEGSKSTNHLINLVVAANYRDVKNVVGVVKALVLLSKSTLKRIHIDWYGDVVDDSYQEAMSLININCLSPYITLNSSSKNIIEKYHQADVVGLFSHYEGFPNAICEALSVGKMVICTPVSDLPQLLDSSGNIICASSSAEDIAQGLEMLTTRSFAEIACLSELNKRIFEKYFNKSVIISQMRNIILS